MKKQFLSTFLTFFPESMKIKVKFIKFFTFSAESVEKIILLANQPLPVINIKCTIYMNDYRTIPFVFEANTLSGHRSSTVLCEIYSASILTSKGKENS